MANGTNSWASADNRLGPKCKAVVWGRAQDKENYCMGCTVLVGYADGWWQKQNKNTKKNDRWTTLQVKQKANPVMRLL